MNKDIIISVVDGQGGGLGKNIVGKLKKKLGNDSRVSICALGTNSNATSNMMKAGADMGATGENAIKCMSEKSDIILGSIAIIAANSMLGELTPAMALAISSSAACKILIPLNRCNLIVATDMNTSTDTYIDNSIQLVLDYLSK